jgi:hypothetical protein
MAADQDRAQKRIAERVIFGAKVHVEIFGFPSDVGIRYNSLYPSAAGPACLCNGRIESLARLGCALDDE